MITTLLELRLFIHSDINMMARFFFPYLKEIFSFSREALRAVKNILCYDCVSNAGSLVYGIKCAGHFIIKVFSAKTIFNSLLA